MQSAFVFSFGIFISTDLPRGHLTYVQTRYSHLICCKGLIKSYVIIWHVTYILESIILNVDAFVVKKHKG